MKGYKGFDKDWKCLGKQYAVGRTETEEDAVLCKSWLDFCAFPLDCFAYYPPTSSRYGVVEAEDVSGEQGEDSKRAAKRLTVIREIGLEEMIEDSVRYILEKAGNTEELATNTGNWSAATNTGYQSAAISTGRESKAKGALGCGIVLCEYDGDGRLAHIAARIVDGVEILPDTYYTLRGGKLVQAEEDEP